MQRVIGHYRGICVTEKHLVYFDKEIDNCSMREIIGEPGNCYHSYLNFILHDIFSWSKIHFLPFLIFQ